MEKIAKLSLAIGLLAILVSFLENESCYAADSPVILAEYQAWFDSASPCLAGWRGSWTPRALPTPAVAASIGWPATERTRLYAPPA